MVVRNLTNNTRAAEASMETLREHFKPHLGLPKARLTCFLMLVLAIIGQWTVSLVWLARHPHSAAKGDFGGECKDSSVKVRTRHWSAALAADGA